jgi:hypothetical protein
VAGGDLEVFVALELLLQPLQGLGRAVVLQAEDDPVAGFFPHAKSVGLGDPVGLAGAVAFRPPQRQVAVVPPPGLGQEGAEEPAHRDEVSEALHNR